MSPRQLDLTVWKVIDNRVRQNPSTINLPNMTFSSVKFTSAIMSYRMRPHPTPPIYTHLTGQHQATFVVDAGFGLAAQQEWHVTSRFCILVVASKRWSGSRNSFRNGRDHARSGIWMSRTRSHKASHLLVLVQHSSCPVTGIEVRGRGGAEGWMLKESFSCQVIQVYRQLAARETQE